MSSIHRDNHDMRHVCGELAGTIGITGTNRAVKALQEARDDPFQLPQFLKDIRKHFCVLRKFPSSPG